MATSYECNTHYGVPYTRIKYLLITSLLLEDRDCITFLCVFSQHLGYALFIAGTQSLIN